MADTSLRKSDKVIAEMKPLEITHEKLVYLL
jgi:hypothetical protein